MKQKILRQIQILRIGFFGIDLKVVIRVREKGNSYLMSTELGKMLSDVAFSSSLHPFGANRGSWIQNLYNLSINNCPNHCFIKHFSLSALVNFLDDCYSNFLGNFLNNRFLRERGMASNPKMEYQVFLCILQKNSAMATLCLKEMGNVKYIKILCVLFLPQ